MSWMWDGDGERVDFITEDLAVANLEAASDPETLIRHDIRGVVDASNREGNPRFPGIHYHEVPIADPDERLVDLLPGVVAFIDEARRHGNVLLHCVAGVSRSPALAICYLHERHGLSLPAALHHVCSRRAHANPHPLFLRLIHAYYDAQNGNAAGQPPSPPDHRSGGEVADPDRQDG
jgi:histidinol-phosphate aminotransferase